VASGELSDLEQDVLAFERLRFQPAGAKYTAIRDQFGMSPWRYQQLLNALLDRPGALRHDP
jgi:hypothetical protein